MPSAAAQPSPTAPIAVIGAGPAGLTAAYALGSRAEVAVVFEAGDTVGGIAKTVVWGEYRFDLGGHRFFTKLAPIQHLWERVLGDELLVRPRLSRIYFHGSFFAYPLQARDVLRGLGPVESTRCALSYVWSRLRPPPQELTFEDWVVARFGKRLYANFFGPYTKKVWGIPGTELRAEWAAQRIKGFSFGHAVTERPRPGEGDGDDADRGVSLPAARAGSDVGGARRGGRGDECPRPSAIARAVDPPRRISGDRCRLGSEWQPRDTFGGGCPLQHGALGSRVVPRPAGPLEVIQAAESLRYRDFCLVALVIDGPEPFPDNWIYLHDPGIRAGRVQNFGAWSPDMVVPGTTCLGAEYFCSEGDDIWTMPEEDLIAMTVADLARIGLVDPAVSSTGSGSTCPAPIPSTTRATHPRSALIRGYLASFENLVTCGRNGLHRYNNQDHSMWTALLATSNLLDGAHHDVWDVNTEQVYHEEGAIVDDLLGVEIGRS